MNEKTKSIVAYIFGFISGLIVLLMKDSERNTRFHAAQSVTISLGVFIINVAYSFIPFSIPMFSTLLNGAQFVFIVLGIVKAYKEEDPELPFIGNIAKSIFNKQIEKDNENI